MKSKGLFLIGSLLVFTSFVFFNEVVSPEIDKDEVLKRHNFYRNEVGVAPLKWSDELAVYAQNWANKLANSCQLNHSNTKYGENIYMGSEAATPTAVIDFWASEEAYFNHKKRTYISGRSDVYGHYSQIIWATTTHVGAGMQKCKHGGEIWVCSYSPAGNMIGEDAY